MVVDAEEDGRLCVVRGAYVVLAFPVAVVIGRMLGGAGSTTVHRGEAWLGDVAQDLQPVAVSG